MEFLKLLAEAQARGVSKEEFFPIYLQQMQSKLTRSQESASSDAQASTSDLCMPVSTSQHLNERQLQEMVATVEQLKSIVSSQLQTFRDENNLTKDHLSNAQREIYESLNEMHAMIQDILNNRKENGSDEAISDLGNKIASFRAELIVESEESRSHIRHQIDNLQAELLHELSMHKTDSESYESRKLNRQEQVFQQQTQLIQESKANIIQNMQQGHFQIAQMCKGLEAVIVTKVAEMQNNILAQMNLQQQNYHQILYNDKTLASSHANENIAFHNRIHNEHRQMQEKQQNQHQEVINLLHHLTESVPVSALDIEKGIGVYDVNSGQDLDNKSPDQAVICAHNYEYDNVLIFNVHVMNFLSSLRSGQQLEKVLYTHLLGCCLRGTVYFPKHLEADNIMDITLDICQVGNDVNLPDILRTSTEIKIVDLSGYSYDKIIARENGAFHMSRHKKLGWFEMAAVFLDLEDTSGITSVENDSLFIQFQITVIDKYSCVKSVDANVDKNKSDNNSNFDTSNKSKFASAVTDSDTTNANEEKDEFFDAEEEFESKKKALASFNFVTEVYQYSMRKISELTQLKDGENGDRSNEVSPLSEPETNEDSKQVVSAPSKPEMEEIQDWKMKASVSSKLEAVVDKDILQALPPLSKLNTEESHRSQQAIPLSSKRETEKNHSSLQEVVLASQLVINNPVPLAEEFFGLYPHSTYYFLVEEFTSLIGSPSLIDSPEWYLQFLGHNMCAVLAFTHDNTTMTIHLDYFHGSCDDSLPESAVFKCRVSIMDRKGSNRDLALGESIQIFDMTRPLAQDWLNNFICLVDCGSFIKETHLINDEILLKFDFFLMDG